MRAIPLLGIEETCRMGNRKKTERRRGREREGERLGEQIGRNAETCRRKGSVRVVPKLGGTIVEERLSERELVSRRRKEEQMQRTQKWRKMMIFGC
jgi:hypothetical protein